MGLQELWMRVASLLTCGIREVHSRLYIYGDTGSYSVVVTDKNGCRGDGFIRISSMLPVPSKFLPADTSICSYSTLTLRPAGSYKNYLWSTGSALPAITISQAGQFWLEVSDENNCIGRDTIAVASRQCLYGFFIPNSFTPNHDGKNDVFQPLIFGPIKYYLFTIYNRWGKVVFQSHELAKGWDGSLTGLQQGNDVFVWQCVCQLEGEKRKVEKGTVITIR